MWRIFYESRPSLALASTFQVKVLSGRALPSFPGTHGDCSTDLKLRPAIAYRRKLFKAIEKAGVPELVTCIGTRFDESARRAANMTARGESHEHPVRNKEGELVLSPISDWSTEDVWEAIALYSSGELPGYSDFEDTKRIYATPWVQAVQWLRTPFLREVRASRASAALALMSRLPNG